MENWRVIIGSFAFVFVFYAAIASFGIYLLNTYANTDISYLSAAIAGAIGMTYSVAKVIYKLKKNRKERTSE